MGVNEKCKYIEMSLSGLFQETVLKERIPFVFLPRKFYLKDNNKTLYLVGHSKSKPLYLEDSYERKIIMNKLEASLTTTRIEQSYYGMKNIPYLSIVAEVIYADVYLNTDASKTNEEDEDMNIIEKKIVKLWNIKKL